MSFGRDMPFRRDMSSTRYAPSWREEKRRFKIMNQYITSARVEGGTPRAQLTLHAPDFTLSKSPDLRWGEAGVWGWIWGVGNHQRGEAARIVAKRLLNVP